MWCTGEGRCYKMCVLPPASAGMSPPASCLSWVQNDNESSEQPAVPQHSGEQSKIHSGLLWASNWDSKSLCHLSLMAGVWGKGVGVQWLWSPAEGGTRPEEVGCTQLLKQRHSNDSRLQRTAKERFVSFKQRVPPYMHRDSLLFSWIVQ